MRTRLPGSGDLRYPHDTCGYDAVGVRMIAGIETGGTKVMCAVSRREQPDRIVASARIPTTTPAETSAAIDDFFSSVQGHDPIDSLGIASFGPVNVDPSRPRYGWITGTTKTAWRDTPLLEQIALAGTVPTAVVSDVSGAALGEHRWGAGVGHDSIAYATFGTGVGAGVVLDGRLIGGNGYPEVGHVLVKRHPLDSFEGSCPFHGDCVEGLAAGPAVMARWGVDASHLPESLHTVGHEILGFYIAQVVAQVTYSLGVTRFILGGGVLEAPGLLDEVRRQLTVVSGGPMAGHGITLDPSELIVAPALSGQAGVMGALALAEDLLRGEPLARPAGSPGPPRTDATIS